MKKLTEQEILTRCGWTEKQLGFLGTMVINVVKENNTPIMHIITHRTDKYLTVECFIPNKEGDKITLSFSKDTSELISEKTTTEIKTKEDVDAFLTQIESTIKNVKGDFFPSTKISVEYKSELKFR